jgi:hypothetical protein
MVFPEAVKPIVSHLAWLSLSPSTPSLTHNQNKGKMGQVPMLYEYQPVFDPSILLQLNGMNKAPPAAGFSWNW